MEFTSLALQLLMTHAGLYVLTSEMMQPIAAACDREQDLPHVFLYACLLHIRIATCLV